ncbi:MAG: AAA family ATPase [Caulobacteraceae bacterium]|nr:AAA family ATPase [Caulobacteraceae bacterium]
MTLDDLGPRIIILGPSNSGKSTLAEAIARARGLQAIHLDQLHHQPGTDWVQRPPEEFVRLHAEAIAGERWVMDGNYSRLLPSRLERATGVIRLELPTAVSLYRYARRSWFERGRVGALDGGRDSVKWVMIHHIAVTTRSNRARDHRAFESFDLPKIRLATPAALNEFYRANGLSRP